MIGVLRGGSTLELTLPPGVDCYSTPGCAVAVLPHAAGTLTARTLLDDYQRRGTAAVAQRMDDCTVVLFDESARTLILARDLAGMTPLYYAGKRGNFAFGSCVSDVIAALRVSTQPDLSALVGLLVYHNGPFPGQTFFEDVFAVPGGHMLVKCDTQLDVIATHTLGGDVRSWNFRDAADEFGGLLQQAVARRVASAGTSTVFVSGGLDSGAIACIAARNTNVKGVNYGLKDDATADETRYLDALRRSGIAIEHVPFFPTIDVGSAEQSIRETEVPILEMVPLTLARAAARALSLHAPTVLMGTWGDQVLAPFPPPHHRSLAPWRIQRLARAYHEYMTDVPVHEISNALRRHALRSHAPGRLLERRRERLARHTIFDSLADTIAQFGPVDRVRNYRAAVQRALVTAGASTGAAMATKWAVAQGVDARLPFLDRDLLQFLSTLPDEIAYHRNSLKPLLRESMKGIVPDFVRERRDKGDYTAAMRVQMLPTSTVLDLLDGLRRPVKWGLISPANARKTLARIERESNIWDAGVLGSVVGLDIWLRLFFEK